STADDPIIRDNAISTSKLADLAVTDAKISSISGTKVNGNISGEAANVTGTVSPSHGGTGVAGTLNGYVKANGISAMQGLSTIPVGDVSGAESTSNKSNDIALDASSTTKYPNVNAVKTYVDNQIAQGTIPDATTTTLGRIRLGGDLAGTGTSANNPVLSNNSVTSAKIADLAVTNAKIVSVEGSKISSDVSVNAVNITGVANASHGGTGAAGTLTGYIKGNGLSAMTSSATIPIGDVANAENVNNKSTATDLGNSTPSDQLYPSQKAVKSYVDAIAVSSVGSATQNALNLKENTANKSTGDINGNSVTSFPTQSAVKSYVESKLSSQTVALGNLQTINPDKVLGNFGASSAVPSEIATTGTGAVVRNTAATLSNVLLNGSIGGNAVLSTSNGGLGTGSLTAGYVKAGTPFSTVSTIPVADVTGAVQKVNGYLPDANGNIALRFGTTYTGLYNNGNFAPVISTPINSDVFIVSGDPTATNNGRAFIFDGTRWNEITMDRASLDAQYVKLTGSTMQGNLVFPTGKKIQQVDAPTGSTDVANRAYVDQAIAANTTSDATNVVFGKIRLGGDLAASSSTAANPIITNGAITSVKIADGAVTEDKLSAPISGAKGGTGVNNTGKTITLGGNLTTIGSSSLTLTTTANSNVTLPTSGTLATLSETESLTNKTINGIQFTSNPSNFTMTGGSLTARTLTVAGTSSVSGTNTGDQTIVLSGDLQGSGTGNITATLNNTGVIAGVYGGNSLIPQITVDAKGRITQVTEINLSNTTLAGTILNDGKFLVGNGSNAAVERSLSGDVSMNNIGVTSIGTGKVTNGMLAGNIDLSSKVSNVLPITNGGTGVSSLTNNALLVGGSTLGFLAPGSSGNILSSNGTQWSSNPISSLGVATSVGSPNSTGTSNGMTLLAGELKLSPADGTNPGIITTGTQSLAGNKTFLQDLSVNQIVLGSGGGNLASNTRMGNASFSNNSTGSNNTAMGYQSLQANTSGTNNTALGVTALALNTTGNGNTAIGNGAGVATGNLSNTIAIGSGAVVATD
ncbi:MAG: beta strand repeat-containing protein, partial [Aquirufa sp.]